MPKILNLTQHPATPAQVVAGVVEPNDKAEVIRLLTFYEIPTATDVYSRAGQLAAIAAEGCYVEAMIGGAPYLMPALSSCLSRVGVKALFSFTERKSAEVVVDVGGRVTKSSVFEHIGFVDIGSGIAGCPGFSVSLSFAQPRLCPQKIYKI
jgi:hypothetical protein